MRPDRVIIVRRQLFDELLFVLRQSLGDLDLEDNTVQRAVDARIAATRSYKLLIEKGASLNEDIDAARGRIHEVVDRHNALIGELNVACLGRSPDPPAE